MFEAIKTELGPGGSRISIAIVGIGLIVALFAGGKLFWFLWIGLLTALVVRSLIQDKQRTKLIREFALRMGFSFLGHSLPKSYPMQHTSSRLAHSICRVMTGDRRNKEVLLFDCRLGHGKGTFSRTVVAVRGEPSDFGWSRFGPDLSTTQLVELA